MAAASGLLALTLLLVLAAFLALPLLQAPYAADEVQPLELLTEQRELVLRAPWKTRYLIADEATIRHLDFETERGRANLGDEWDAQNLAKLTPNLSLLAKYADYNGFGPGPFADRDKLWLSVDMTY